MLLLNGDNKVYVSLFGLIRVVWYILVCFYFGGFVCSFEIECLGGFIVDWLNFDVGGGGVLIIRDGDGKVVGVVLVSGDVGVGSVGDLVDGLICGFF